MRAPRPDHVIDPHPLREYNHDHDPANGQFSSGGGTAGSQASAPDGGGRTSVPSAPAKGQAPTPNLVVQTEAAAYAKSIGLPTPTHEYAPLDQARAGRIADAYDALPVDDSANPATKTAYEALGREVRAQWDHAKAHGMNFEPWTKPGQPYATSTEMEADVQTHRHLYFYTGGDPNAVMAKVDPATGFSTNDMFRAVHDYYGHSAGGFGFGPRGEENAWRAHSQMFSMGARRALTTEARGQSSWVNFGKQNYDSKGNYLNIPPSKRPYAPQKFALLPDEFVKTY